MDAFYYRTLFVYLIVHAYLFWHIWALCDKKRLFLFTLPLFAGMGLFPVVYLLLPEESFLQNTLAIIAQYWLPVAFFCLLVFVVFDIFRFLRFAAKRLFPNRHFTFPRSTYILSVILLLCAALYSYGLFEAQGLRLTHLEMSTTKLPPDVNRIRIAFASDLHISPHTGISMLRKTVDTILAEKPDCILLGGDLLDDSRQGTIQDLAELERLQAPLGVFAVLGNHDAFGDIRDAESFLRKSGITVLVSETVFAGPLAITGMDDPTASKQRKTPLPDALSLLQAVPESQYSILLDHRPYMRPECMGKFELQLSGHSHGGQIFMFKPYMRSHYGVDEGLSEHTSQNGKSLLYISNGVGFSKLPIRLDSPPEIVIIDLVRQ